MVNAQEIKPHMPVVCSENGQFAEVDHLEGSDSIKLTRDPKGQHHFIPLSWVTKVDDKVHVDRPGNQAMHDWTTTPTHGAQSASFGGDRNTSGTSGANVNASDAQRGTSDFAPNEAPSGQKSYGSRGDNPADAAKAAPKDYGGETRGASKTSAEQRGASGSYVDEPKRSDPKKQQSS